MNKCAAVRSHFGGESHFVIFVDIEAGEIGIFLEEFFLAGGDIDDIQIVVARVAVVEADDDVLGIVRTDAFDFGADFFLVAFFVSGVFWIEGRDVLSLRRYRD